MTDEPKYDVAISFLAADEPTAKALADQLESSELSVFFFPRNQEELAGTDGFQSMREPFLDARIVAVLYREPLGEKPWGETPWTRIEETAIKDRCLNRGWSSLMFVTLNKPTTLPRWLPETHIRYAMQDYGVDQLVGAIKLRVQEQGGTISPPDAMSVAKQVQNEAIYLQDRDRLMHDRAWIENTVHASLHETINKLVSLAEEANTKHGIRIECCAHERECVLRSGFVSMLVRLKQPIYNSVSSDPSGDCFLRVGELSGTVLLPQERRWVMDRPQLLQEHRFRVDVAQDRSLIWVKSGSEERIAPSQLADRIMRVFLDLVSRANQGKVERP
jgi:hypothetical protein